MDNENKVWAVIARGEQESVELFSEQNKAIHREAEIFKDFLRDKDIPCEAEAREWNHMLENHSFCLFVGENKEIVKLEQLEIQ